MKLHLHNSTTASEADVELLKQDVELAMGEPIEWVPEKGAHGIVVLHDGVEAAGKRDDWIASGNPVLERLWKN